MRATIRRMQIKCPYCYTPFTSSELCKTHCESEHADELAEPLGKDFYIADYLKEEEIFYLLKEEFTGRNPDIIALEARVAELLQGQLPEDWNFGLRAGKNSVRHILMSRRIYLCLWPCTHIPSENVPEEEHEVNLNGCCDARKYFGEFMDAMCDSYNSDYAESE
jgi:hypothetical protein